MNSFPEPPDLRVRRTQKLLWEALTELMAEKAFDAITVKDICDRAMVHRTTFYKHYTDKYDLLLRGMRSMHEVLQQEMRQQIQATPEETSLHRYELLLTHVLEHERFYRLMLCGNSVSEFHRLLRGYLADFIEAKHTESKKWEHNVPLPLFAQFHAGALISIIAWWLENDCPYTLTQMALYMEEMMHDASDKHKHHTPAPMHSS
uniref:TetR family transcriptional regulator n=1 Tax=Thermosporothrix sp. COM3 TaxID=2490863 RepID=A0A455SE40_9CHLR|nr:TetR family transcriptional regulator [Thermosporothrix sp. COM3]